jgi:polyhydroxyalkanoate synthesis regulator phasin
MVEETEKSMALPQISEKKLAANMLNAQKSTGPRTQKGKDRSRWNALKHGLLAKQVVVPLKEGKESKAAWERLLAELREDLAPQGVLEEIMVERIAECYWRLGRGIRSETAEIAKQLESARRDEMSEQSKRFSSLSERLRSHDDEARRELEKSSLGLEHLIRVLNEARDEVQRVGYTSKPCLSKLSENFGSGEGELVSRCSNLTRMAIQGPPKPGQAAGEAAGNLSPEECKRTILGLIDSEKEQLEARLEVAVESERREMEVKYDRLALPPNMPMEKILRYETAIERQLYRAISQLERLQRQRKGEPIPPVKKVDISSQS